MEFALSVDIRRTDMKEFTITIDQFMAVAKPLPTPKEIESLKGFTVTGTPEDSRIVCKRCGSEATEITDQGMVCKECQT